MHARAECLLSIEAAWVFCVGGEHLLCGDEAAPQPQVCLWELGEEFGQAKEGKNKKQGRER